MIYDFLAKTPVFSRDDFVTYRDKKKASITPMAIKRLLNHYSASGVIVRLRQNLFATNLDKKDSIFPLSYFIAAKLAPDSVLAYHTAMMVRGNSYSMFTRHYYLSLQHIREFNYREQSYKVVAPQKELITKNVPFIETEVINVLEQKIRVTTIERTLVDSLDNPVYAGGWEELWRNFDNVPTFKWENLLNYIQILDKPVLYAKLGFYLTKRQQHGLHVPQPLLEELANKVPKQPYYIDAKARFSPNQTWHVIKPWQLIVPDEIINQSWEEVYQYQNVG